jgi:hypothetical protein
MDQKDLIELVEIMVLVDGAKEIESIAIRKEN